MITRTRIAASVIAATLAALTACSTDTATGTAADAGAPTSGAPTSAASSNAAPASSSTEAATQAATQATEDSTAPSLSCIKPLPIRGSKVKAGVCITTRYVAKSDTTRVTVDYTFKNAGSSPVRVSATTTAPETVVDGVATSGTGPTAKMTLPPHRVYEVTDAWKLSHDGYVTGTTFDTDVTATAIGGGTTTGSFAISN